MGSDETKTNVQSLQAASISPQSALLNLPDRVREDILKRVLRVPHPIYLFQETGSRVEAFAPDRPRRWLSLLYVNQQILVEASAALYGTNHFHLVDITHEQVILLQSFLECIGPVNAASISHICISFPSVESIDGQPDKFEIREDSLKTVQLLQEKCTRLSTLETIVHGNNCDLFKQSEDSTREALSSISALFKTIPSLKTIIIHIKVYNIIPSVSVEKYMSELNWVLIPPGGTQG